jgi:hypothetical protein
MVQRTPSTFTLCVVIPNQPLHTIPVVDYTSRHVNFAKALSIHIKQIVVEIPSHANE